MMRLFPLSRVLRGLLAPVLLLAIAVGLQAQDKEIVVEKNPSDPTGFVVVKTKLKAGDDVQWDVFPKPTQIHTYEAGGWSVCIFNGPGDKIYTTTADWINWDSKKRGKPKADVLIGKAPQPPPTPDPGPKPPDPIPPTPKTENPFGAAPGAKLLIVVESEDNTKLPVNQFLITNGTVFRIFLNDTFGEGNYLILDQNAKFSDEEAMKPFKTAMSRTDRKDAAGNKKLPWLYVGKEASGMSVPLQADGAAAQAAINKFLGK